MRQRLIVEQLNTEPAMMKLVAHQLPVGCVTRQAELVGEHHQDPLDRDVIRHLYAQPLVSGGVPDLEVDIGHRYSYAGSRSSG